MSGGRLCLGLHITKCAGTSLITNLRRRLSEDEYYFCSSYYENWLAGRPLFAQVRAPERLRIVFGHYVHRDLLSVFADREVFLFTGLRDPVARAISDYRQLNAVRARAGGAPLEGGEYIAEHASAVCAEILRAFPAVDGSAPWEQARAALEAFDYIYDTDAFEAQARTVFEVLDVPVESLASDNVSDHKTMPAAFEPVMRRGCDVIRRETGFLEQDLALWEWARPRLGHMVAPSRPDVGPSDAAQGAFCARETGYLCMSSTRWGACRNCAWAPRDGPRRRARCWTVSSNTGRKVYTNARKHWLFPFRHCEPPLGGVASQGTHTDDRAAPLGCRVAKWLLTMTKGEGSFLIRVGVSARRRLRR